MRYPPTWGTSFRYQEAARIAVQSGPGFFVGPYIYSPPVCIGCKRKAIVGAPDIDHVSTSFAERQNLTMRMSMRRFTRLTNAFSKKLDNLRHAVALHFMHYNFCRVHQSLNKKTPAMAAGVAHHVWTLNEVLQLCDSTKVPN